MKRIKRINKISKDSELPSQIPPEPHDNTEKPDTSGAIPGAVIDQRSNYSLSIWQYLIEEIGLEGEVKQSEIASKFNCSVRTVQRVLEGFKRCNLVEWESYNGQGRGIYLENLWLERGKDIANKLAWKRGYEAEDEYLKTQWTRQGQLGTTPLDYNINIETSTTTKDQNPGFDSSSKFINNKNLTPKERRKRWLEQFPDSEKTSAREGFQEVLMEDLRTFLQETELDPEAVKATCDTFWKAVKKGTLEIAREALETVKNTVVDLIFSLDDDWVLGTQEVYSRIHKYIYFEVLKPEDEKSSEINFSETPEETSEDRGKDPRESGSRGRGSTPETFGQDKAKAKRTRQQDTSGIIGEIFDSDSFSLGSKDKDKDSEANQNFLKAMEKTFNNYGEAGLKRWCRNHSISFVVAKKKLGVN